MPDITSSSAVFMLSVPLVFPVPQQLQGFSTDDAFDTDSVEPGETKMGVDGIFSAGVLLHEALSLGLPALYISLNTAQEREARIAARYRAGLFAGSQSTLSWRAFDRKLGLLRDPRERLLLSQNARRLVDGNGAERIARVAVRSLGNARPSA